MFSTTQYVCDIRDDQIVRGYQDIERGEFCFSDGCGNVNPALALKAARFHGLKKCSAIQLRVGGAKGVCMIKPSLMEGVKSLDELETLNDPELDKLIGR